MSAKLMKLILAIIIVSSLIFVIESRRIKSSAGNLLSNLYWQVQNESVPELAGISGYINTDGITLGELKGKVVLVDFWTYTCINCIRTLPHLVEWYSKYSDNGLEIIGVHTPEFEFEKEYDNVLMAVERYGIKYPVVQDNEYVTWSVFKNRFWPHKYLIDANGMVRYDVIGEGRYAETEKKIVELLEEAGYNPVGMAGLNIIDTTPTTPNTPELYAGYSFAIPRGQNIGNKEGLRLGETVNYTLPSMLTPHTISLENEWQNTNEYLLSRAGNASINLYYTANAVNIVSNPLFGDGEIDVFIDGKYITQTMAGRDVVLDEDRAYVVVNESRLYNVVDGNYGSHLLKLVVEVGFSFNAFTFG